MFKDLRAKYLQLNAKDPRAAENPGFLARAPLLYGTFFYNNVIHFVVLFKRVPGERRSLGLGADRLGLAN